MPAASKHCPFLRLLEVHNERAQVHYPCDGTHDVRDTEDVSSVGALMCKIATKVLADGVAIRDASMKTRKDVSFVIELLLILVHFSHETSCFSILFP